MSRVVVLPNRKEWESMTSLMGQGFNVTSVRGPTRNHLVVTYIPTLTKVVPLHRKPAHSILEWLR